MPIYNLMEDAATAEISRTQIWQWLTHRAALDDGRVGDADLVNSWWPKSSTASATKLEPSRFEQAGSTRRGRCSIRSPPPTELADFLTLPAYEILVKS